ncbi:ATP-dependent RNA helicase ddx58 [Mactra antiquata]
MGGNYAETAIERRVDEWKSYICRVIRPTSILRWMPSCLSQADVQVIKYIELQRSLSKAALVFLDKLKKSTEPGKWTSFNQALEFSDYPYLAHLLSSECQAPENSLHQRRMLQIFAPYLDILEPIDIMIHLTETDLINSEDKEEILACHQTQGSIAATMLMLDRIQRRQAPSVWYTEFLKVLFKRGYSDIVKEMEPEFVVDSSVLKVVPSIVLPDSSESEEEGHFSMNSLREDAIEQRVFYFKSQLSEMISVEKLLPSICSLINIDRVCHVMTRTHSTRKEAMESVLEEVSKSKSRTKWRNFVDCLTEAEYPYVAELLKRPRINHYLQMERNVLNVFAPTIGQQLDPVSLMPYLEVEGVINKHDKKEILSAYNKAGTMSASFVLLECMQCRKAPSEWYKVFLKSLIKCDQSELAEIIDPECTKKLGDNSGNSSDTTMNSRDAVLDNALEEAYVHVYNEHKSNVRTISSIKSHYQGLELTLVNKNEEVYHDNVKHLNALSNKIESLEIGSNENERSSILECISAISNKRNEVIADSHFMTSKQIGIVKESFGSLANIKQRLADKRKTLPRKRHLSLDSSSSSSSGFLEVARPMSVDSANDVLKPVKPHRVTFSKSTEKHKKPSIKLAHYVEDIADEKRKAVSVTNRRRCFSESSILSTDGSMCSSVDRFSSSTNDVKTESSSISSSLTKVSNVADKKPLDRTDSFVYHHGFLLPKRLKCSLRDVCVLPNKHIIFVNHIKACLYIFDEATRHYNTLYFNRLFPLQVCSVQGNHLVVLHQKRDGSTRLLQYKTQLSTASKLTELVMESDVLLDNDCKGCVCSIASTADRVLAVCSNKHLHVFAQDFQEQIVMSLDIQESEFWPHLCAIDSECNTVFVNDLYTLNIYCFKVGIDDVKTVPCACVWSTRYPDIEGMVVCNTHLYVSKNTHNTSENVILRLHKSTGYADTPLRDHVHRPFALSRVPDQDTIIVTQFHPEGRKVNRTVKYF